MLFAPNQKTLAALIERFTMRDGSYRTAIESLWLHRVSTPTEPIQLLYAPALCVIAQGGKRIMLGDEIYAYDPAHYLLVSVDLPLLGQVVEASPESPYLSMRIDLDPAIVSELWQRLEGTERRGGTPCRGLAVSPVDFPLLEALVRLLRLLDHPEDVQVVAPLILTEITYRLLKGEQGARLCQIAMGDGPAQRIAKAINWLKHHYAEPFRVEELAREAHMSPSSFHAHFKLVTTMSPLQYQKQLRLQEARRLMLSEALDAAAAGFRVGYESPSQFSREYRRLFGEPPSRDVAGLRKTSRALSD